MLEGRSILLSIAGGWSKLGGSTAIVRTVTGFFTPFKNDVKSRCCLTLRSPGRLVAAEAEGGPQWAAACRRLLRMMGSGKRLGRLLQCPAAPAETGIKSRCPTGIFAGTQRA